MNSVGKEKTEPHDVTSLDTLTWLPNRTAFLGKLEYNLDDMHRNGGSFIVLFINLDGFRSVNESLGHTVGDQLLLEVSRRLCDAMRPQDVVAHFGADEFTVLAKDVSNLPDVESIIQRIQRSLGRPYNLGEEQLSFSASIGVVISSEHYENPDAILRDASIAVHRAKSLGKARHQIFDVSMHQQALLRLGLEGDLRRAIEQDEFELYYQPFISLPTDEIVGFEALIRWNRPGHGIVEPQEFIPVAEKNGLIVPMGSWVLRQGCRQICNWLKQFPDQNLSLGINVASLQISQSDLVGEVTELLRKHQLDAQSLELEITESGIVENPIAAADVMQTLNQMGVQLSIDDFGTGYSSLSQLYRFPFDTLKIDRLFISQLCDPDDDSSVFVEAILQLAKNLGMIVIAEGIETGDQLRKLKDMGCDIGQGYFFSKPVSRDDATALLERSCATMT